MKIHFPYTLLLLTIIYSSLIGYLYTEQSLFRSLNITIVSLVIICFGLILGLWVRKTILSYSTTLNPDGIPTKLVVSGPFRYSRNPMYLSYLIVALGVSVYAKTPLAFIGPLFYFLYLNYRIIPKENQNLSSKFHSAYHEYKKSVRKWI